VRLAKRESSDGVELLLIRILVSDGCVECSALNGIEGERDPCELAAAASLDVSLSPPPPHARTLEVSMITHYQENETRLCSSPASLETD